jgi:hypothetical protein
MGKFMKRLAIIGAAVGGFLFFWRKRQGQQGPGTGTAGGAKP